MQQTSPKQLQLGCGVIVGLAVLFGIVFVAYDALAPGGDADAVAKGACDRWVQTYGDGRDGLLTGDELRERVKSINDRAQYADDEDVQQSSRSLLAAVTSGTDAEITAAMEDLTRACGITQ